MPRVAGGEVRHRPRYPRIFDETNVNVNRLPLTSLSPLDKLWRNVCHSLYVIEGMDFDIVFPADGLYTKITGGWAILPTVNAVLNLTFYSQWIDLFGVQKQDLPDIWVSPFLLESLSLAPHHNHTGGTRTCQVWGWTCLRKGTSDHQVLREFLLIGDICCKFPMCFSVGGNDLVEIRCGRFGWL
jgi:hypothetical protein